MQAASRRGFASVCSLVRLSSPRVTSHAFTWSRWTTLPRNTAPLISNIHTSSRDQASAATAVASAEEMESGNELITRFADLSTTGLIHHRIVDTITHTMKLETMTEVQSQTINHAVQGVDTLAVARTGTGKTVAFLLPVIQRILKDSPELEKRTRAAEIDIRSIIISPTRELAEQIAKEASRLVTNTGIKIGLAVGGTGRIASIREMHKFGCHILVATPGRLNDLLSDRASRIKAKALSTFVLDEADRLLDDGFGPAIQEIYKLLPSKAEVDRQTLMFSATMEPEVMGMVKRFMKPNFCTVRTVSEGEIQTHEKVPQRAVVTQGLENQMPTLFELIKRESTATENFKAIVFFNTSAEAILANDTYSLSSLQGKIGIKSAAMTARLTQGARTKTSNNFRTAKQAIMFSSDVAARGMDFPNVTHVIQIGVPKDRDTYIHRIGRTGRAGKEGQAFLLLNPWDIRDYVRKLRDLPIDEDTSLNCATLDMSKNLSISSGSAEILTDAIQSAKSVGFDTKSNAYRAGLNQAGLMDKRELVHALNRWSKYGWGLDEPPAVARLLATKLGLARIPELRTGFDERAEKRPEQSKGSYSANRDEILGRRDQTGRGFRSPASGRPRDVTVRSSPSQRAPRRQFS